MSGEYLLDEEIRKKFLGALIDIALSDDSKTVKDLQKIAMEALNWSITELEHAEER